MYLYIFDIENLETKRNIEDFGHPFLVLLAREVPDACRSWIQERQAEARILGAVGCFAV